ncbi:MAG TPA: sugar transferase [Candidatus Cryosericum sp.]|nr:sugar transferase [Candidatus Cryosericum sp.]
MSARAGGRAWCRGRVKRAFDLTASSVALLLLAPLALLIALLLRVTSGPPVLFRQERVGLDGRSFRILKFRTMRQDVAGPAVTALGDGRITAMGRMLRACKLDEVPQLLNVVRGDMSVVGPRPELPRYVALYSPAQRRVLDVRPGLTDDATVAFRDEERLLGAIPPDARERYYVEQILPRKLDLNLAYIERAGFLRDLAIILQTARAIVVRSRM